MPGREGSCAQKDRLLMEAVGEDGVNHSSAGSWGVGFSMPSSMLTVTG